MKGIKMKSYQRIFMLGMALSLTAGNFATAQSSAASKGFTISGTVGPGLGGVEMKGFPSKVVTDENGYYIVTVESGWSGTVTPTKAAYTFRPAGMTYTKVNEDRDNQNFIAERMTLTISGSVGIAGVVMNGLPGNPVTDSSGNYSITVDFGWAGNVSPHKEGYTFTPPAKIYSAVSSDMTNQNYTVTVRPFVISGNVGIDGVEMQGLPGNPVSDSRGHYRATVDFGWSGVVTPKKEGYTFKPESMTYSRVLYMLDNQNYVPRPVGEELTRAFVARSRGRAGAALQPAFGRAGSRRALVIPAEDIKPEELAETVEDMYIFSNILDEGFKEPRMIQGVFRDFGDFFGRDNRQTDAVYMQDYGVVFLMEVDYTFTPAPQTTEQPEEQTKEADSTWQRAKERMFSPGGAGRISRPESARENDAQMVEELKTELIRTLRHATNIRNIEPDEWVILSVTGTGRQSGMMGGMGGYGYGMGGYGGAGMGSYVEMGGSGGGYGGAVSGGYGGGAAGGGYGMGGYGGTTGGGMYGGGSGMMGGMGGYVETGVLPATVLTIRAKKSDVDAFAKGDIDYQQFRQKVQILMY
jgi:hypothetical protein